MQLVDLRDNTVIVDGDLSEGDIIATAGVEFLSDGLEVRLYSPPQS